METKVSSIAQEMADKKERIYYEAASQKAEAVVFVDITELDNSGQEMSVKAGFKYKICGDIKEVTGLKTVYDSFRYSEIPAYLHRMAEESEDYREFKRLFEHEHPGL